MERRIRGDQQSSAAGSCSAGFSVCISSVPGRCRQLGDFPWASAPIRCFIVGGRALAWDQTHWYVAGIVGAVRCVAPVRGLSVLGAVVAAAAGATIPSAVNSATKAVTMTVHSFMTLFWVMAPHFRVGRFAYFPHDVYVDREVVDLRPWRGDVPMNTTRMDVRGLKESEMASIATEEGPKSRSVRIRSPSDPIGPGPGYSAAGSGS